MAGAAFASLHQLGLRGMPHPYAVSCVSVWIRECECECVDGGDGDGGVLLGLLLHG